MRFPHLLRGVVLHEPRLAAALAHPEQVMGPRQAAIQHGTQAKGPAGGMDAFLRYVMGDATVEAIPPPTLAWCETDPSGRGLVGPSEGRHASRRPRPFFAPPKQRIW